MSRSLRARTRDQVADVEGLFHQCTELAIGDSSARRYHRQYFQYYNKYLNGEWPDKAYILKKTDNLIEWATTHYSHAKTKTGDRARRREEVLRRLIAEGMVLRSLMDEFQKD